MTRLRMFLGMALIGLTTATGCVARGVIVADDPPPVARVTYAQPRPGYVWVEGHWMRDGGRWAWRDGHYVRDRSGHVYVQGDWRRNGRRWEYRDGQWQQRVRLEARIRPVN